MSRARSTSGDGAVGASWYGWRLRATAVVTLVERACDRQTWISADEEHAASSGECRLSLWIPSADSQSISACLAYGAGLASFAHSTSVGANLLSGEHETRDTDHITALAFSLAMPEGFRHDFLRILEQRDVTGGREATPGVVRAIFDREYMIRTAVPHLLLTAASGRGFRWFAEACFRLRRWELIRCPIRDPAVLCASTLRALGMDVTICDVHHAWIRESGSFAVYARCSAGMTAGEAEGTTAWGAGIARDAANASRKAVLVAIIRARAM